MPSYPNAKINIGLNIVSKREDGYHNIESIIYPVIRYSDTLEIIPSNNFSFSSSGNNIGIDPKDNLCVKAYKLLASRYDIPPVKIILYKSIPIGGGLGGGSSDAAFTLFTLNRLFYLAINNKELEELALKLGSDCPFYVTNRPCLVSGKGEILTPVFLPLRNYWVTIITPYIKISTKEAYSNIKPKAPIFDLKELEEIPLSEWKFYIKNDFEEFVFDKYHVIKEIKDKLYDLGAIYASLSGSGSSVYAISKNRILLPHELNFYITYQGKLKF